MSGPLPIYRSASGFRGRIVAGLLRLAPAGMALLRRVRPVLRLGSFYLVTRYDDVVEVFATDAVFEAPYAANLRAITGGEPFFLGMRDGPAYHAQVDALRAVVRADDLPALGDRAEALAQALVDESDGRIEVVRFVRTIAFKLIGDYFGVPEPDDQTLAFLGSRLFEFQFTGSLDDKAWLSEAEGHARRLRDHIDETIAERKAEQAIAGRDDVLARCLALQAQGRPGYGDVEIRTAILCMIVGGPPQPPMVMPQALEQLLRRPDWLQAAQQAARTDDGDRLHDILIEAMRFDPLAPGFRRVAIADHVLAKGTRHARSIRAGGTILAATASAMMDGRRLAEPRRFDPERQPHEYLHFGHGLHECFGRHINHATLHRMLIPLLRTPGLRRAPGRAGRLVKRGPFADQLTLEFDTP